MTPRPYDEPEPDEMDVADEVAYADTGRPWAYRTPRPLPQQQERRPA
jgi:hypothetical protein